MQQRVRLLAIAAVALAIGIAFGPTFATAADSLKDVIVRNGDDNPVPTKAIGTTQVTGSVAVNNLPTAGDGSVRTSAAAPTLRDFASFLSGTSSRSAIPPGVVLTDAVIRWDGGTDPCRVTFDAGNGVAILLFDVGSANRTALVALQAAGPATPH